MPATKKSTGLSATAKKDTTLTAKAFIEMLYTFQSDVELKKILRYFKTGEGDYAAGDQFIGVKMGQVFALAKSFKELPLPEIELLLNHAVHEVRVGAVSIMDFQARSKTITEEQKKALFELYIKRHDRINNWDLVDRSAPYVVGAYLADKPRTVLYKLARSKNIWERRTAIVSTYFFIRQHDVADTFKIAEILLQDPHELIQKATGSWLREAGSKNKTHLEDFLNKFASVMPRITLRYALEHMDKPQKAYYMNLKAKSLPLKKSRVR